MMENTDIKDLYTLPGQSAADGSLSLLLADLIRAAPVEGLDVEKGLECFGGDGKSYMDSLRSYVVHTPPLLAASRTVGALEEYAVTIHGIKGSSYGISADAVGQWAERLEYAAKAGDLALIEAENDRFAGTAEKFITDLTGLLGRLEKNLPRPRRPAPNPVLIQKIRNAAEDYDINELDHALEELEQYIYRSDADLASWLREQIVKSEFEEITGRLMSYEQEVSLFVEA
ncbi:MAG: hypothetical protein LBP42_01895 [Treponema sp.]|nr:hypothetical protein [Treponema sp.]